MGEIVWYVFKLALTLVIVFPMVGLGICFAVDGSPFIGIGLGLLGVIIFLYALIPSHITKGNPTHSTIYEGSVILLVVRDQYRRELRLHGKGRVAQGAYLEVEVVHEGRERMVLVPRKHLHSVEARKLDKQIPEFAEVDAQYFAEWKVKYIESVFA